MADRRSVIHRVQTAEPDSPRSVVPQCSSSCGATRHRRLLGFRFATATKAMTPDHLKENEGLQSALDQP